MQTKQLVSCLVLLLLIGCDAGGNSKYFVSASGDYSFYGGALTFNVTEDDTGAVIKYKRKNGSGTTFMGSGSRWFYYVESSSRVWRYDGEGNLALMEETPGVSRDLDVSMVPRLWDDVPRAVKERLPESVVANLSRL